MFDELEMLGGNANLQRLLGHYAEAGEADREAWQDRLMALEGVEAGELVKLHGLLIAFGWVDQNTGNIPAIRPGTVPGCYRVTAGGLRAGKAARTGSGQGEPDAVETVASSTAESPGPKRREWRKGKPGRSKKAPADPADVPEVTAGEQVPSLV